MHSVYLHVVIADPLSLITLAFAHLCCPPIAIAWVCTSPKKYLGVQCQPQFNGSGNGHSALKRV